MADNTLQIGATVILDGLQSGMQQATSIVQDSTAKMGAAFQQAAASSAAAEERISYSMSEARHAVMLMGEETGVHLPRAVATMLAHIEPLGGILAAAFPIIGAIALVEVLDKGVEKLIEMREAEERAQNAAISFSTSMVDANAHLTKSLAEVVVKVTELTDGKLAALSLKMQQLATETSSLGGAMEKLTAETAKNIAAMGHWYDGVVSVILGSGFGSLDSGLIQKLTSGMREVSNEATSFGVRLHAALSEQGTAAGLQMVTEKLTELYQKLQQEPNNKGLIAFRDTLEGIQKQLSTESSTQYWKSQELALEKVKEAAKEHNKLLEEQAKFWDFLTGRPLLYEKAVIGSQSVIAKEIAKTQEEISKSMWAALEAQMKNEQLAVEAHQKAIEEMKRLDQEKVHAAEQTAHEELQIEKQNNDERLRMGLESRREWAANERAALDRWYQDQKAVIDKALADLRANNLQDSVEYQKLLDQKTKLDLQYELQLKLINSRILQDAMQLYDRIGSQINSAINSWVTGHQNFAAALRQIWQGILTDILTKIEQMVEKWIWSHVIMAAISKALGIEDTSSDKTAQAQKAISADAAQASADVFLQAIEGIPFPANLAAAPALALATLTQVEAFGAIPSAESGWDIPRGMNPILQAHEEEMVLPAPIARRFREASGEGVSTEYHAHFHQGNVSAIDTSDAHAFLERTKVQQMKNMLALMHSGHFKPKL